MAHSLETEGKDLTLASRALTPSERQHHLAHLNLSAKSQGCSVKGLVAAAKGTLSLQMWRVSGRVDQIVLLPLLLFLDDDGADIHPQSDLFSARKK